MATQSTGLSLGQSALAGSQALRGGGMLRERQIELFADRSGEAGGDLVVSWDGGCANPVCASPLGVAAAFGDLACSVASEVSLEIAPFSRDRLQLELDALVGSRRCIALGGEHQTKRVDHVLACFTAGPALTDRPRHLNDPSDDPPFLVGLLKRDREPEPLAHDRTIARGGCALSRGGLGGHVGLPICDLARVLEWVVMLVILACSIAQRSVGRRAPPRKRAGKPPRRAVTGSEHRSSLRLPGSGPASLATGGLLLSRRAALARVAAGTGLLAAVP